MPQNVNRDGSDAKREALFVPGKHMIRSASELIDSDAPLCALDGNVNRDNLS